jgi:mannose-6-phosphate isomerase-like protein (cupin superfamily)
MSSWKIARIDDIEAIAFGSFRRARATLGANAFGLQVLDLAPNLDAYPEHDHGEDGQEEVYVTLRGSGEIEIEGERHPMTPEELVFVGPGVKRKIWPGADGMRVLAIGGVAGKSYEATPSTELGAPDPFAQPAA